MWDSLPPSSINSYAREVLFCFELELFEVQPYWFALYQWRAGKDWLMTTVDAFATHANLVSDGHRDRLQIRKQQCSQLCFHDRQTLIFNNSITGSINHLSDFSLWWFYRSKFWVIIYMQYFSFWGLKMISHIYVSIYIYMGSIFTNSIIAYCTIMEHKVVIFTLKCTQLCFGLLLFVHNGLCNSWLKVYCVKWLVQEKMKWRYVISWFP